MRKILIILSLFVGITCVEAKPMPRFLQTLMFWKKNAAASYKDPNAVQDAFALLYQKHQTEADTIAIEISEYFRKAPKMQVALAKAYYQNNDTAKAKYYLRKALKRKKAFAPAFNAWGEMYCSRLKDNYKMDSLDRDSALYWYGQAIKADPKDKTGYVMSARVLAKCHDIAGAKDMLQKCNAVNPDFDWASEYTKLVLQRDKYNVDAKKDAINSTDPYKLGVSDLNKYAGELTAAGDYANALKFAQIGIKRFPAYRTEFSATCLKAAFGMKEFKTALEYGEYYIKNTKDTINSAEWYSMGASELGLGNNDEAFEYFAHIEETHDEASEQMAAQMRNSIDRLLKSKKRVRDYSGAIDMYSKFVEKYPSKTSRAYQLYNLAELYMYRAIYGNDNRDSVNDVTNACNLYKEILEKYPDWDQINVVYYQLAILITNCVDKGNAKGLAIPYYIKFYDYVDHKSDAEEYEKDCAASAAYYSAFYYWKVKNDNKNAMIWSKNTLKYDSENNNAKRIMAELSGGKRKR